MLTCKEVTRLCSDEFERPLRLGERTSLQLHLMMCTGCANYRRQMQSLRQFAQGYAEGRAPPGDPDDRDEGSP